MALPDAQAPAVDGPRRWRRVVLSLVAMALLGGAVWVALSQADWRAIGQAHAWQWGLLVACVVANLLLAGAMFWSATWPFDARPRVALREMTLLVTASALFNFLPLRPGLAGRAAYLKARHGLPVRQSLLVLLIVLVMGGGVTVIVGVLAWALRDPWALGWALLGATCLLAALAGPIARRLLRRPMPTAWLWGPLRMADALVAGVRLWVAFDVMGMPIGFREALMLGAAGLLLAMIGLTPNGLGLKEWLVAAMAQGLAVSAWQGGLSAALVDRGVEALVVLALGLLATGVLWRRWSAVSRTSAD